MKESAQLQTLRVTSKKVIQEPTKVYDIEVDKVHHYLLNSGVVSHNSIGGYFPSNVQSGGCMIPGTLIQTPDGLRKIEDLKAGDMVLTLEGPKEITHTWMFDDTEESDGSPKKTWEIEFEDGVTYQVSEDHRFLINQDWENDSAWKKVWELTEDDEILAVVNK